MNRIAKLSKQHPVWVAGDRSARRTVDACRTTTWAVLLTLICTSSGESQIQRAAPEELDGVGIEDRRGTALPTDVSFTDASGETVQLGEFFRAERPILLTLTYSSCPLLCHLQLEGLVDSLRQLDWSVGERFDVVNISIDPEERWHRARETKRKHIRAYGRPETAAGWHFLTGNEESIQQVAKAAGFNYRFVPERNEYAHAACVIVCTPTGEVARYLYGVDYPKQTMRLALVEAGDGKIGSAIDQLLLFCFHYDAESGRYTPMAFRVMQLGGLITLSVLAVGLIPYWRIQRKVRECKQPAAVGKVTGERL